MSTRLRERLRVISVDRQTDTARDAFIVLAALHDAGKCEPQFQGQSASRLASQSIAANRAEQATAGLPGLTSNDISAIADPEFRRVTRHEAISGHLLCSLGFPAWASAAVAGHHGRYQMAYPKDDKALGFIARAALAAPWAEQQESLVRATVHTLTGPRALSLAPVIDGSLIPFLTGLICLADWTASDDSFIASSPAAALGDGEESCLIDYYTKRIDAARPQVSITAPQNKSANNRP